MGEFRIGRTRAQHSYPESRFGGGVQTLARNFANGPKLGSDPVIDDSVGTFIPWGVIDSAEAWDAATDYVAGVTPGLTGDIVAHNGTTWIALLDNTNVEPGTDPLTWEQNTVVPITPRSSGVIVIETSINIDNGDINPVDVNPFFFVNGVALPLPPTLEITLNVDGNIVTIFAETSGLPLGVRANVQIQLIAGASAVLSLQSEGTVIEVREVIVATG